MSMTRIVTPTEPRLRAAMPARLGGLTADGIATCVFCWRHRARHEVQ
jgi:hypothetical protein